MDQFFLNNEIYKYLTTKKSSVLVSIIDTTYQHCEYILGEIPKEFYNYTFHDIHHAIRIINYMTEFVKPNINEYSDFHLALILLVGLLHDTGLFVSDEEKREILSKIIKENNKDNQQEIFQDYIREQHAERVRIILDNYFIDEYTNSKFSSIFRLDDYSFSDDIALICQSHTESLEWIKRNLDVTKYIANYNYNPQQIALLLMIGDNLDIDARRAPYSLFKLRNIKGYSEIEWKKHNPIKNYEKIKYVDDRFHIYFSGDCDNAFIYRKVMDHILWLQNICSGIRTIASNYDQPYRFILDEKFDIKIEPKGFESTDLHFSLDYSSVLKLLMGEHIYGEKKVGLRELLQNSIDAIMVMHEKLSDNVTSNYKPTIWIEMNKENNTISVCDNGIGMNDYVLKNYFFNIGKSYYVSKDYKKLNLKYSAIGHFGLGFLACFMLSSNVRLETQSSGCKPITVEFEKTSQFVTKLKSPDCIFSEGHGTRISLSYDEIIPNVFSSEGMLVNYVAKMLLIEDFEVKIIFSSHETIILDNKLIAANKHIKTEQFDIHYTPAHYFKFWYGFSDIWAGFSSVLLFCHSNDFDNNNEPFFVDLNELERFFNQLKSIPQNEPVIKHFDILKYYKPSIQAFITSICKKNDNVKSLRDRVNDFVFSRSYEDGKLKYHVMPSERDKSLWIDLEWYYRDHNYDIAIVGLTDDDLKCFGAMVSKTNPVKDALQAECGNDFYKEYSNSPVEEIISVVKSKKECVFLPIQYRDLLHNGYIYMHGILVDKAAIIFPCSVISDDYIFKELIINVKSDEFELNLSRKDFSESSLYNLCRQAAKALYNHIANEKDYFYNEIERELIKDFVEIID